MNLKKKKYQKVIRLKKKFKFTDFDLITNYGLFSGDTNLFKTLTIFDLISKTSSVKGDIIELGIHRGNTSLLIKKILSIFKIKKKLYLLDHFIGDLPFYLCFGFAFRQILKFFVSRKKKSKSKPISLKQL